MKKLILINGTMGIGKTTVSKQLADLLQPSVFLDGDWCWNLHPFLVNEQTKQLVLNNITYQLNQFLQCEEISYIIFCWVMQEQSIIDTILERLQLDDTSVMCYSLLCDPEILRMRLAKDIACGIRKEELLTRTLKRLPLYEHMDTIKIDVSKISASEAAKMIADDVRTQTDML